MNEVGFTMRAVITDDHSTNVSAFNLLIDLHSMIQAIRFPTNHDMITYLFHDPLHLVKNVRNNLLNNKRYIFPKFEYHGFYDPIVVSAGEISWKLLHDVRERDEKLQAHLHQGPKLTYRALHPGNNKQCVKLALAIFDPSTAAAIRSYYLEREDAAAFLTLIYKWWIIFNAKQKKSNNLLGHAAVIGDMKRDFLRKLAGWFEEWQKLNMPKLPKPHTI